MMQAIHEFEGPTYDELERENARLRGRLAERHRYHSWMVALNGAMMVANVYMFGQMIAVVMGI